MKIDLRKSVILLTVSISLVYLFYRAAFTLNLTSYYAGAMSVALIAAEAFGILSVVLFAIQVWHVHEPPMKPPLEDRTVDIFVPTYNEDIQILRATLEACSRLEYPHRVYLCDDGGTEARCNHPENGPAARERQAELKALCEELNVTYLTRPKNEHAKAGNLNHAFTQTDGEFIIIFDADHVPEPHFIVRLIGYFEDERLGFIQTPHAFYNFNSFQARLDHAHRQYWEEGALFYGVIQPGRNRWNCPIFAGSAAMFRRKALEEVGYIALETITEDMHTGMRMNAKGWKSLAISERMVAGQAAPDITTFHTQRLRWGEGNLSIMAYDNPLWMRGLTLSQRFCYLGSMVHWAGGIFKLIIYSTPILMMLTGISPVKEFTWVLFVLTVVYMLGSLYGVKYMSNGYGSIVYGELFAMINFWTQVRGLMRAVFWRKFQQFVVTSKRGRQSKSIWPFIQPQVILFLSSFLALAWGWSRVLYGISDDFFKPIIPSCWIVFHMVLVGMAVRRALWPEDSRFSFRHAVNVVARYETPAGNVGCGVTVDLNELGAGVIGFRPVAKGDVLDLELDGAGEVVMTRGVVVWVAPAFPGKVTGVPTGAEAYRFGVKFDPLPGRTFDAINRITLQYGVPRLYLEYAEGNKRGLIHRVFAELKHSARGRIDPRRPYKLPVLITSPSGESVWTVSEDMTTTAVAVLLPMSLRPGADVAMSLVSPLGELNGQARVRRAVPVVIAAREYYRTVFEFHHLQGDGPNTIQRLITPRTAKTLKGALIPEPKPLIIPTARPAGYATMAAAAVLGFQLVAFPIIYSNDLFLRNLAAINDGEATPEQSERFETIYNQTMAQAYPSNDRLVLLMQCLRKVMKPEYEDSLVVALADRDVKNFDLQRAKAHVLARVGNYELAEREYNRLLELQKAGRLDESQREELLLTAARTSYYLRDYAEFIKRFQAALAQFPDDLVARNEFAGLLIAQDRYDDAIALYEGQHLSRDQYPLTQVKDREGNVFTTDPVYDARVNLMSAYALSNQLEKSTEEAGKIRQLRPNDPKALQVIADIAAQKKNTVEARELYEKLVQQAGNDPLLRLRLGQLYLGEPFHDYVKALEQFQIAYDYRNNNRFELKLEDLYRLFNDAAAGLTTPAFDAMPTTNKNTLAEIDRAAESTPLAKDPVFLSRMAWNLERMKNLPRATLLLSRARTLKPDDPDFNKQFFSLLVAQDRLSDALNLMKGRREEPKIRQLMVDAYLGAGRFDEAEQEVREVLKASPNDLTAMSQLADILSWGKKFPESLVLFEELAKKSPYDRKPRRRLAEVRLWSGDTPGALKQYETLLSTPMTPGEDAFNQPILWPGFVDAAAGVPAVSPEQLRLAKRIAGQSIVLNARVPNDDGKTVSSEKNVMLLARLGWVLTQAKQSALLPLATDLLDRAVKLTVDPTGKPLQLVAANGKPLSEAESEKFRKELAGMLAAVPGSDKDKDKVLANDALRIYDGIPNRGPEDHKRLANIYVALKRWPEAETQARAYLRLKGEGDHDAERLLADVLSWGGEYKDSLDVFARILKFDPDNQDVKIRIAEVTLWSKDHAKALDLFTDLLEHTPADVRLLNGFVDAASGAKALTARQKKQLVTTLAKVDYQTNDPSQLGRMAWVCHMAGLKEEATKAALRAVDLKPTDDKVRKELGGTLAALGEYKLALGLFAPVAFMPEEKLELARMYTATGNFADAENVLEAYLKDNPTDPHARFQFANVLSYQKNPEKYTQSLKIMGELQKEQPMIPELPSRIAEVTLWSGKASAALVMFTTALEKDLNDHAMYPGFIDAAAAVKELSPSQTRLIEQLFARFDLKAWESQPGRIGRLALLLHRIGGRDVDARTVMTRALGLPQTPDSRRELAASLALMGEWQKGVELFQNRGPNAPPLSAADRTSLVGLYVAGKQWKDAEREAQRLLTDAPNDPKAQRLYADVLAWKGDYKAAIKKFDDLRKQHGNDAELAGREAEVTLFAGDAAAALARFEEILKRVNDLPADQRVEAWRGFISAAAMARSLTPGQMKLALQIADDPETAVSKDVQFLGQLAWVMIREKKPVVGNKLLDRAVDLAPSEQKVRRELANVLASAGRADQALEFFGGEPATPDDFLQRAGIFTALQDFPRAIRDVREYLKSEPTDPKARMLFANLLSWNGDLDAALLEFEQLRQNDPKNTEIAVRIAESTLWADRPMEALTLFARVLVKEPENPDAVAGFISAAFHAGAIPDAERPVADRVRTDLLKQPHPNAVQFARFGYAYHKASVSDVAQTLLDRAVVASLEAEPPVRWEVYGLLNVAGRKNAAAKLREGLEFNAEGSYQLAQVYGAVKDYAAAVEVLRDLVKRDPASKKAKQLLADDLTWDKKYAEALNLLKELYREHPDDANLPVRIAQTLVLDQRPEEAVRQLLVAVKRDPLRLRASRGLIEALAAVGNLSADQIELVKKKYVEVVGLRDIHDPAYQAKLGRVLRLAGMRDDGDAALTRALDSAPRDPQVRRQVANALAAAGWVDQALGLLEDNLRPDDYEELAYLNVQIKNWTAAMDAARKYVDAYPNDPKAKLLLSNVLAWGGKPRSALAVDFYDPAARRGFVSAVANAPFLRVAERRLLIQLARDPATMQSNDAVYLAQLAAVMMREGLPGNADGLLDRAASLTPATPNDRRELASVLAAAGRDQSALAMLVAVANGGGNGEGRAADDRSDLANIYASLEQYDQAIKEADLYVKEKPNDRRALRLRADILSYRGDYDAALTDLGKLAATYPDDKLLQVRLAEVALWANRPDEALDRFTRLLLADPNCQAAYPGFVAAALQIRPLPADAVRAAGKVMNGLTASESVVAAPGSLAGGLAVGVMILDDTEPILLAKIGYLLQTAGENSLADVAFSRAIAASYPDDLRDRNDVGAILAMADRKADADHLTAGLVLGPAELLDAARLYMTTRNYPAAIAACRAILAKDPADRKTERLLADALTYRGGDDVAEGLKILQRLRAENPDDPALTARIAQSLVWAERPAEAVTLYQAELAKNPNNPVLLRGWVEAAAAAGNANGKLAPAEVEFATRLFKDNPAAREISSPAFLAKLARVLQLAGMKTESDAIFDRVIATPVRDPATRRDVAGTLAAAGRVPAALRLFDGVKTAPEDFYQLAYLNVARKDWKTAEEFARGYQKAFPKDRRADQLMAEIALTAKDYDRALSEFAGLLQKSPDSPAARMGFVNAAGSASRLKPEYLQQAAKLATDPKTLDSTEPMLLSRLASVLIRNGQPAAVAKLLDRAIAMAPKGIADRRELAGVLAIAHRPKEEVLAMFGDKPTTPDDILQLAGLYTAMQDWPNAIQQAKAYLAINKDDPKGELLLANLLAWSGKHDDAIALYEKLTAADPSNPEIPVRLAETMLWSGRTLEALERLTKLLTAMPDRADRAEAFVAAAFEVRPLPMASLAAAESLAASPVAGGLVPFRTAQLGYILQQAGKTDVATKLLDRAASVAIPVEQSLARRELAAVFALAQREADAARLTSGLPNVAGDFLRAGEVFAAAKDFKDAIAQYQQAVKLTPTDTAARRKLADALSWNGNWQQAIDLFQQLQKELPDDKTIPIRIAEIELWRSAPDAALKAFAAILNQGSTEPRVVVGFVEAAAAASQLTPADQDLIGRIYREFRDTPAGRSPVFQARLGRALQRMGREGEGAELLAKVVAQPPTSTDDRRALSAVLASARRFDDALKLLDGLPPDVNDLKQRAYLESGRKNWDAAEKAARDYLAAGGANAEQLLADVLSWRGKHAEARELFVKLAKADPKSTELQVRIAQTRLWSKDTTGAADGFMAILDKTPEDAAARTGFASAVMALQSPDAKYVDRAAALAPAAAAGDAITAGRLAAILARAGRPVPPELVAKVDALTPGDSVSKVDLIAVLAALGKRERALDLARGSAKSFEESVAMAGAFAAAGDYTGAVLIAREAADRAPGDAKTEELLADVLSWKKEYTASAEQFKKLVSKDPQNFDLQIRLAEVLLWSKDYTQAAARYESMAAQYPEALKAPDMFKKVGYGLMAALANLPAHDLNDFQFRTAATVAASPAARAMTLPDAARTTDDIMFLTNTAWILHRGKANELADKYLSAAETAALANADTNSDVKKSLAGVLETFGRIDDAVKMFKGLTLTEGDRFRLAGLYATDRQYDLAEAEVRAILEKTPNDPKAVRLLADILSWNEVKYKASGYKESLAEFARLKTLAPNDKTIPNRVAEVTLWAGKYDEALGLLRTSLTANFEQPNEWSNFIDAAASAKTTGQADTALATLIYQRVIEQGAPVEKLFTKDKIRDGQLPMLFLSRLAWVLYRGNGEKIKIHQLLDAAIARKSPQLGERRELAGVLLAVNRPKDALTLFESITEQYREKIDLLSMGQAYAAEKRYSEAAQVIRHAVSVDPSDKNAQLMLVDVLTRGKDYTAAMAQLEMMRSASPGDPAILGRIANVYAQDGKPSQALPIYRRLLILNLEQPHLWRPFMDAVSSSPSGSEYADLVAKVAPKLETSAGQDPDIYGSVGAAYGRIGDRDKALNLFRQGLEKWPESRQLRRKYAETLSAVGRYGEAAAEYRKLEVDRIGVKP